MPVKFYYDLISQPARAIYIFLKINGINFVDCPVALRKGEHLSKYAKILPFQKVPVIDDDGFVLSESAAILKYLAAKYKVPDHWYPSDLKKQARVDEFLNWQHLNLRANAAMYFRVRVVNRKPADDHELQQYKAGIKTCLDEIEGVFLRNDSPFINGAEEITIADLLAAAEIEQPIASNYDILANRPVLSAYMERVRACLQPHYDNAHQYLGKIRERIIQGKL